MPFYTKHTTPSGIPFYHMHLPDAVEAVALHWVIFVGSADDHRAGAYGAYHWFEHVPFRGTVKFPHGYRDTKGRFTEKCGATGAWTNSEVTCFWANVHHSQWEEALEVTTDLWSQPLMRQEDIESERTIIYEEIRRTLGKAQDSSRYRMQQLLMPDHPLGHPTLGTPESLKSMHSNQLSNAHRLGYDKSRAILFVCGNVTADEISEEIEKLVPSMPTNGLSARRKPIRRGDLPDLKCGTETVMDTSFASTIVHCLYPIQPSLDIRSRVLQRFLVNMVSYGGGASPL